MWTFKIQFNLWPFCFLVSLVHQKLEEDEEEEEASGPIEVQSVHDTRINLMEEEDDDEPGDDRIMGFRHR